MFDKDDLIIVASVCFFGLIAFVYFTASVEKQKREDEFKANPGKVISRLNEIATTGEYAALMSAVNQYSGVTNSPELDKIREKLEVLRIKKEKRDAEIAEKERVAHLCSVKKASAGVYAFAQIYTKQLLKSPSTADFASILDARIDSLGKCKFVVDSYVDAQNSFGVPIRTRFVAVIERNPNGDDDYKMIKHAMK